jgi:hypothetical protein
MTLPDLLTVLLCVGLVNGRIPASQLMRIPGNGRLIKSAARAYWAMWFRARRRGVSLSIIEGRDRRTYRELAAQFRVRAQWCALGRCQNAAIPGTSNHGLGIALDLMSMAQRKCIDRIGAPFGWAKRWSDAAHEWWHLKWRAGVWDQPVIRRTVRRGSRGQTVRFLQRQLRKRGFKSVPRKGAGYGHFGATTYSAVKRVQRAHGLNPDGVVGPATWVLLLRG